MRLASFLPVSCKTLHFVGGTSVALWTTNAHTQSSDERRRRHRVEQYFDCSWLSDYGEEVCRVSSLSPTGCYIEGRFSVPPVGSPIQAITVTLPTGPITVQGEVVHAMPGVGFAVRFTEVDDRARARLTALAQTHVR